MIRSRSSGSTPPFSKAFLAAETDIETVVSSPASLLSLIPVRLEIHSSLVSTTLDRSSFVTLWTGTALPVPIILAVIALPLYNPIVFYFKYFDIQNILFLSIQDFLWFVNYPVRNSRHYIFSGSPWIIPGSGHPDRSPYPAGFHN